MSVAPKVPMSGVRAAPWRAFRRVAADRTNLLLLLLLAVLCAVFWGLIGGALFAIPTLQSMAFQLPELGILSLAMMTTLLSGGLDLSIVATADLCALAMAYVLTHAPAGGIAWLLWQVLALGAGALVAGCVGLVNGFVVAYVGVSPILVTLGTMTMVRGLAVGLTHGTVLSGFPPWIVFLGNGTVGGVPMPLIAFAAVALPMALALSRSPFGVSVALIGSNERATRFSGVDTRLVLLRAYTLSSLLSAMAALLMMARFNSANADYGQSYLLVTILAAVLGGINPTGGFGKVSGLVLALVILQLISSAFNLLNLSEFLTLAIWGGVLIAVAAVPVLRERLLGLARRPARPRGAARPHET